MFLLNVLSVMAVVVFLIGIGWSLRALFDSRDVPSVHEVFEGTDDRALTEAYLRSAGRVERTHTALWLVVVFVGCSLALTARAQVGQVEHYNFERRIPTATATPWASVDPFRRLLQRPRPHPRQQRYPVLLSGRLCRYTRSDFAGVPRVTAGSSGISCSAAACTVLALNARQKFTARSADGKDTDRITLLPGQ